MRLLGKDSSNQCINLLNTDTTYELQSSDISNVSSVSKLQNIQGIIQVAEKDDTKKIPSVHSLLNINHGLPPLPSFNDLMGHHQRKKLVFFRRIPIEGKQKLIRKIANSLFPQVANQHVELTYHDWIHQLVVNQGQMSEKNGAFNNKKKLIASVLRKIIEFQSGVPIGQVPWKKITKSDITGWPKDIDIKSPSRLNALELNMILLCLDKLEFKLNN